MNLVHDCLGLQTGFVGRRNKFWRMWTCEALFGVFVSGMHGSDENVAALNIILQVSGPHLSEMIGTASHENLNLEAILRNKS